MHQTPYITTTSCFFIWYDWVGVLAKLIHPTLAGLLPIQHRDPFDRMLMAQAELENLAIITYDSAFYFEHLTIIPPPKT